MAKMIYIVIDGDGVRPEVFQDEDAAYDRVGEIIQELAGWYNWSDEDYDDAIDELQAARENPDTDWVGLQGVDDCGYWRVQIQ